MKFSHSAAFSFGKTSKGKKFQCFKLIGRLDRTDPLYTPGPGQYDPSINRKSAPKWRYKKYFLI